MKELFDQSSFEISHHVTRRYSTSFSLGIKLFHPSIRNAIYAIYGFVRYADEIVDSFGQYDRAVLMDEFIRDYNLAIERKISLNPILNSFQHILHQYDLKELSDIFLESMMMDLHKSDYHSREDYEKYIYGSADVVGLMCLKVFVDGDVKEYNALKKYATRLGSAFQKVNFLRDFRADNELLGRSYFPNVAFDDLNEKATKEIIDEIREDIYEAKIGIRKLPLTARLGVYLAYKYYYVLLRKIERKGVESILNNRIRISNSVKMFLVVKTYIRYKVNLL